MSAVEGASTSGRSTPVHDFGLEVLQELGDGCETPIQIIFLHGLGGSKRGTWTHDPSGECWPLWLRNEKGFESVRLALFGYDANMNVAAPNTNLNVRIFANQLLFDMEQLHYLTRPAATIFVAHSLGGLVVKKAIIDAYNDGEYANIAKEIKAVVFLGTPHRGAELAKLLEKVLKASFSKRQFVSQLTNCEIIRQLNISFMKRVELGTLKVISFFETENTRIHRLVWLGVMVVPEESATLGNGKEKAVGLDGNDITMVKYASKGERNYARVSTQLHQLVTAIAEEARVASNNSFASQMSAFAMAGIVLSVLPPVLAAIHARRAVAERPQLRNLAQALPEVHRELREAISNGSHNGGLFKASKEGGARFFTAWLAIGETDPHVIDTLETIKNFRPILDRLHEVLIHILKPLPNARSLRDIVETERDDPTYSIKNGCLRFDSKAELLVAQELSMKLRIISKDLKSHNGHKPTGEFHRPGGSEKAQSSFFDSIRHYSIQLYRVLSYPPSKFTNADVCAPIPILEGHVLNHGICPDVGVWYVGVCTASDWPIPRFRQVNSPRPPC